MKYEDKSDFEINEQVARLRFDVFAACHDGSRKNGSVRASGVEFDPCNNPSDAWPIIEMIWERLMQVDAYYQTHTKWEAYCIEHGVGKLRAAMICFLKMKGAENE